MTRKCLDVPDVVVVLEYYVTTMIYYLLTRLSFLSQAFQCVIRRRWLTCNYLWILVDIRFSHQVGNFVRLRVVSNGGRLFENVEAGKFGNTIFYVWQLLHYYDGEQEPRVTDEYLTHSPHSLYSVRRTNGIEKLPGATIGVVFKLCLAIRQKIRMFYSHSERNEELQ